MKKILLFLVVLATTTLSYAQPDEIFLFGSIGNPWAGAVNGTPLTVASGTATLVKDRFCNPNCALDLSGGGMLALMPSIVNFDPVMAGNSFSVSLWYHLTTPIPAPDWVPMFWRAGTTPPSNTDWHLGLYDCNGPTGGSDFSPYVFEFCNQNGLCGFPICSGNKNCCGAGDWTNIVLVCDWSGSGNTDLYVNGVLAATNTMPVFSTLPPVNVFIGDGVHDMQLDDIYYYNYAISTTTVMNLYNDVQSCDNTNPNKYTRKGHGTETIDKQLEKNTLESGLKYFVYQNVEEVDMHYVKGNGNIDEIFVTDVTGKAINCPVGIEGKTASVNTSELAEGVYILKIVSGNESVQQRIVVK